LGIGRIIKKWRQDQTVERRPGSGGRRISIRNQDEQLLTVIRNSPFTNATAAVNIIVISRAPSKPHVVV
jgi:hypothetical protein